MTAVNNVAVEEVAVEEAVTVTPLSAELRAVAEGAEATYIKGSDKEQFMNRIANISSTLYLWSDEDGNWELKADSAHKSATMAIKDQKLGEGEGPKHSKLGTNIYYTNRKIKGAMAKETMERAEKGAVRTIKMDTEVKDCSTTSSASYIHVCEKCGAVVTLASTAHGKYMIREGEGIFNKCGNCGGDIKFLNREGDKLAGKKDRIKVTKSEFEALKEENERLKAQLAGGAAVIEEEVDTKAAEPKPVVEKIVPKSETVDAVEVVEETKATKKASKFKK